GPAAPLAAALDGLPGQKLVFTNGSRRHAERVLAQLDLVSHFTGIFDIADAGFVPKPDPAGYRTLPDRYSVQPSRAAMVEDMARNLEPAAALGMVTVLVHNDSDWAQD